MLEDDMQRTISVDIIGAINDHKLKARVTGGIDDTTGEGQLEFRYEEVPPPPHWHPLNYTDPLVLLPGYRDDAGGQGTFRSLAAPGSFTAHCTMDFGDGLLLRKGATINVQGNQITGGYYLIGTARSGDIPDTLGSRHQAPYEYREFLHPAGAGQIIGVGRAEWSRKRDGGRPAGEPIEAIVSSRYRLHGWTGTLPGHLVRTLEIPEADWNASSRTVRARFTTRVQRL
jgi:hypothetical protein